MSTRTYATTMMLPGLVLTSPILAVLCTWLAAHRAVPAVGLLVLVLAGACTWRPDSHVGVLVIVVIAAQWMALVDDHASPWAVGVAVALTLFHTSMAAVTIAPPDAGWTPAMCRRWVRRASVLVAASAGTWGIVVLLDDHRPTAGTALVVASLFALALGGLWARGGQLKGGT